MKTIFILSETKDIHADQVITHLGGHRVFRANTDRYGSEWTIVQRGASVYFRDLVNGYEASDFDSAWLRRFINRPNFEAVTGYDEATNIFLTNQNFVVAKNAIFALSARRSLNTTQSIDYANSKFNHLKMFESAGIKTPKTLITSSDEDLKNFLSETDSSIALKQVYNDIIISEDRNKVVYQLTQKIDKANWDSLFPIGPSPMYFQEYIEKRNEYRVTVVGDKVFTCQIQSQKAHDERAKIDWRHYDIENTPHYAARLPDRLEKQIVGMTKHYGLNFCAIDIVESTDGNYFGLDINPIGQFMWIEILTNLPISNAIADWLVSD